MKKIGNNNDVALIRLLGDYHRANRIEEILGSDASPNPLRQKLEERKHFKNIDLQHLSVMVDKTITVQLEIHQQEERSRIICDPCKDFLVIVVHLDLVHSFHHGLIFIMERLVKDKHKMEIFQQDINTEFLRALNYLEQTGLTNPIARNILFLQGRALVDKHLCSMVSLPAEASPSYMPTSGQPNKA